MAQAGSDRADVVIVGGGAVGSSAAYFLGADAGFGGRVVHGAYLTALVSRLVGVHLPGENALLQSVAMRFRRPVVAGARLSVTGVVDQLSEAVRTAVVKVTLRDLASGEIAAAGKAMVGFTGSVADG